MAVATLKSNAGEREREKREEGNAHTAHGAHAPHTSGIDSSCAARPHPQFNLSVSVSLSCLLSIFSRFVLCIINEGVSYPNPIPIPIILAGQLNLSCPLKTAAQRWSSHSLLALAVPVRIVLYILFHVPVVVYSSTYPSLSPLYYYLLPTLLLLTTLLPATFTARLRTPAHD